MHHIDIFWHVPFYSVSCLFYINNNFSSAHHMRSWGEYRAGRTIFWDVQAAMMEAFLRVLFSTSSIPSITRMTLRFSRSLWYFCQYTRGVSSTRAVAVLALMLSVEEREVLADRQDTASTFCRWQTWSCMFHFMRHDGGSCFCVIIFAPHDSLPPDADFAVHQDTVLAMLELPALRWTRYG